MVSARARVLALVTLLSLAASQSVTAARADVDACLGAHEAAQLARRENKLQEALASSLGCAQAGCPDVVRSECSELHASIERSLPSVVFAVRTSSGTDLVAVRIHANGQLLTERLTGQVHALDPGLIRIRTEAAGYRPVEQELVVRTGEQNRLVEITLASVEAEATPSARPVAVDHSPGRMRAAYVLGGLSVSSAALALGFGIRGDRQHDACRDACTDDQAKTIRQNLVLANVLGPLAGAAAIGSLVAWLLDRRARRHGGALAPSMAVGAGSALVGLHGTY